ncbi:DNA polymerase IV [Inconstantimicrobium mannanitabidum]|uniref:DNA polymerase IV n=1 Tax=Inconstantimicrobium mannanitabidum TaxID=1604901 RepID=A0ACB5R783_9CLOT|nr:DNA polymerase IV [Clostridium sp. TW13]GKX64892.1 DNA polymerase IV [Clostridium sp. TW13]
MERSILHVDMDAFFASVEQRDNYKLRGKPVIVGGTTERGVVSTCSYEARKFGVHSAMPLFIARQKCPQGIFVPVRYWRYKEVSDKVFAILREITPFVEPLSIDEAYLDISHLNTNPKDVAMQIKKSVYSELALTISIGVSYNKFLAKVASDWNKPNGIKVIDESMMPEILFPLSIKKVYGLGKTTVSKLNNIGIFTIKELYELDKEYFEEYLGKHSLEIYHRIRGIDDREVEVSSERKSFGRETTLKNNTKDIEEIKKHLLFFSQEINIMLKRSNNKVKTITIKLKSQSFENRTKSKTIGYYTDDVNTIYAIASELIDSMYLEEPLRLIGLSVSSIEEKKQLEQIKFNI